MEQVALQHELHERICLLCGSEYVRARAAEANYQRLRHLDDRINIDQALTEHLVCLGLPLPDVYRRVRDADRHERTWRSLLQRHLSGTDFDQHNTGRIAELTKRLAAFANHKTGR